uniref:Hypothetical secreted peptide n=1 Tax=Glossina morsitans morsitans TaxID=37546 RepID=D3TSG9_GLOMM
MFIGHFILIILLARTRMCIHNYTMTATIQVITLADLIYFPKIQRISSRISILSQNL